LRSPADGNEAANIEGRKEKKAASNAKQL